MFQENNENEGLKMFLPLLNILIDISLMFVQNFQFYETSKFF